MRKKNINRFNALLITLSLIPASMGSLTANAAHQQQKGTKDGYDWVLWNEDCQGSVSMEVGFFGAFSCSWNDVENCIFRSGKKLDSSLYWYDYSEIFANYDVDYKPEGDSYMGVYGWTEDPAVEYYIVDAWGTWRPQGEYGGKGTVTSDGNTYDIYTSTRYDQPSIHGTETFDQYWSVNQKNLAVPYEKTKIKSTITLYNHFAQWEKCGMRMGKMYEISLGIEGYQSSGSADVNINTIWLGTPYNNLYQTPVIIPKHDYETSEIAGTSDSLTDDFENQTSSWEARDCSVGIYKYDKGYALAANNRTEYWNGFMGALPESGIYSFEAKVKSHSDTGFIVGVQYDDEISTLYNNVLNVSVNAEEWTTISCDLEVPSGYSAPYIYVHTDEDRSTPPDIAMDDVKVIKKSESASVSESWSEMPVFGDVNLDGDVDLTDLTVLSIFLMGDTQLDSEAMINADVQYDGEVDISDLASLRQYISKDPAAVLGKGYTPTEKKDL